ncbi:hypothetical protein GCM10020000_15010 [Streptomyces olivoverticillatus]
MRGGDRRSGARRRRGAPDDPAERPARMRKLTLTAGPEHQESPTVLRTAFRLVWGG